MKPCLRRSLLHHRGYILFPPDSSSPTICRVVDSVRENLEGRALGSLTRVSTAVRTAVEAALTRILTPKRSIDVLREARLFPRCCSSWM